MASVSELVILARAIAAQHNVRVVFDGNSACTTWDADGQATIVLPNAEMDKAYVRGYLDHEAGHVRFTDRSCDLPRAGSVLHTAWNIFEDVYVEERMGGIFPGAASNLARLQELIFTDEYLRNTLAGDNLYLSFLLFKRRGLAGIEQIEALLPQDIVPLLHAAASVPTHNTAENIRAAEDYVSLIPGGTSVNPDTYNVSRMAADKMSGGITYSTRNISAQACLTPVPVDDALVAKLDRVLPPYLQSMRYKPAMTGRCGAKLDMRRLTRARTGDDRIFRTPARRVDKAIEIGFLLDYSLSMTLDCPAMERVTAAMIAMLARIPKVRVFAYGFRDSETVALYTGGGFCGWQAQGSTPLDSGMARVLSEYSFGNTRRLLFVLTDGVPNSVPDVIAMNAVYDDLGIERYGVGLNFDSVGMQRLFTHWAAIKDIDADLAPQLLKMLRGAMV